MYIPSPIYHILLSGTSGEACVIICITCSWPARLAARSITLAGALHIITQLGNKIIINAPKLSDKEKLSPHAAASSKTFNLHFTTDAFVIKKEEQKKEAITRKLHTHTHTLTVVYSHSAPKYTRHHWHWVCYLPDN